MWRVSTLVVEWIEIPIAMNPPRLLIVSTLVVEWIEIVLFQRGYGTAFVSTLVVEWIEIGSTCRSPCRPRRLHPRGGVD